MPLFSCISHVPSSRSLSWVRNQYFSSALLVYILSVIKNLPDVLSVIFNWADGRLPSLGNQNNQFQGGKFCLLWLTYSPKVTWFFLNFTIPIWYIVYVFCDWLWAFVQMISSPPSFDFVKKLSLPILRNSFPLCHSRKLPSPFPPRAACDGCVPSIHLAPLLCWHFDQAFILSESHFFLVTSDLLIATSLNHFHNFLKVIRNF